MLKILLAIRQTVKHREILLASLGAAAWLLQTPLQHHMELSRFQHYSIAIFAIATGFLLQTTLSWRHYSLAGRLAMASSWMYLTAFGLVCYYNPWLDTSFDLQTASQEHMRPVFAAGFLVAGFIASFFWASWLYETRKGTRSRYLFKGRPPQTQPQPQPIEPEEKVS